MISDPTTMSPDRRLGDNPPARPKLTIPRQPSLAARPMKSERSAAPDSHASLSNCRSTISASSASAAQITAQLVWTVVLGPRRSLVTGISGKPANGVEPGRHDPLLDRTERSLPANAAADHSFLFGNARDESRCGLR